MRTKLIYCFSCYLALYLETYLQYSIGIATKQSFRYIEFTDAKIWISNNASLCRVKANRVTFLGAKNHNMYIKLSPQHKNQIHLTYISQHQLYNIHSINYLLYVGSTTTQPPTMLCKSSLAPHKMAIHIGNNNKSIIHVVILFLDSCTIVHEHK